MVPILGGANAEVHTLKTSTLLLLKGPCIGFLFAGIVVGLLTAARSATEHTVSLDGANADVQTLKTSTSLPLKGPYIGFLFAAIVVNLCTAACSATEHTVSRAVER